MSIKQRLRKIERQNSLRKGRLHVIVKFPDQTREEAISEYAEHNKINPDDDIFVIVVKFVDGAKHDR